MRFRKKAVQQITDRLNQLGLEQCPVCGASLVADHRPAILSIGGVKYEEGDSRHDPEADALFMIRVFCQLCGYNIFFDSEQHVRGDEPLFFQGPPELEEELDPED